MDIKHNIHNMVSGTFIVLRSWGAGKHACPLFFHVKMIFCILLSLYCYKKGLSLISRGGHSIMLVSSVSFTKKENSEGFLHLLLL